MGRRHRNIAKGENTVIGSGTVISGGITSDSMVMRIDGRVNGKVETKGDLIIGEEGSVDGDVAAASLILAGSINGNVDAMHKITITAGGKLLGDINTELLAMDETAILQGHVNMRSPKEPEEDSVEVRKKVKEPVESPVKRKKKENPEETQENDEEIDSTEAKENE